MKPTTMLVLGTVLVLVLPISLIGYFTAHNPVLLVGSMVGVVTFPIGAVMLVVGIILKKKNV